MASNYQFRLSNKAESELNQIVAYFASELSNPQAASRFLDNLEKAIDDICAFPESGTPVNNEFLSSSRIRKKFIGNYILYYFPDASQKTIYGLHIVYGKRNLEEILHHLDF